MRLPLPGDDPQTSRESVKLTICLRVAMRSPNEQTLDTLILRTDKAPYPAKQQGRHQVCATE